MKAGAWEARASTSPGSVSYTQLVDAKGLGVREATVHPKATENMEEIESLIAGLVEKGYSYRAANGDVYFRTHKFDEDGKLSHQPLDDLESGARIAVGE